MAKRTDVHAPSNIIPEDYSFVAAISRDDALFGDLLMRQRAVIENHMAATGGAYSKHRHGGNCHICGAYMIDYAVFYHHPTNVYIRTGFDCADKMFEVDTNLFKKVRDERHAMKAAKAGKMKAVGILKELGVYDKVVAMFENGNINGKMIPADTEHLESMLGHQVDDWHYTAVDIVRKLVKYGSISEAQQNYLIKLLGMIENVDEIQAQRDEERANAPDAPEGRMTVRGEVLSTKWQDGYYGMQHKMLVKAVEGFKVWCSVPAAISDVVRGQNIEFVVALKRSDDDRSFAFGSRPSKAKIITEE